MNKNIVLTCFLLFSLPACMRQSKQQKDTERVKRRHHRKEWRTNEWNKTFKNMSLEELEARKNALIQEKDYYTAIKYLEKMISLCHNLQKLAYLILERADAYFEQGNLVQAEQSYKEFAQMYPGHTQIEYAAYKAILCCFYQTLTPDRDQTKTEETLRLTDQFLQRKEVFKTYLTEIQNIQAQCYQKQFQSEIAIIHDYITRGKLTSAQHRLQHIKERYQPMLDGLVVEPEILQLEIKLAQKTENLSDATQKFQELCTKFPHHHYALNIHKKRALVDRF